MTDGVVAEAQDAQATQISQALLVQPGQVIEGQNPEEQGGRANVITIGLLGVVPSPLPTVEPGQPVVWVQVGGTWPPESRGQSGLRARNPAGLDAHGG